MGKVSLTVIMITYNEEFHIEKAIDNVSDIADNIFIVDSFSSDRTLDIALKKGVSIIQRQFTNFGDQWNFALQNCPFKNDWTMKMDPDERLTDELKNEIISKINQDNINNAFEFRRRLWFMGKPLHVYSKVLRIWKTGMCKFSDVLVNEHPIIDGSVGYLKGIMEHLDSKDLETWLRKQNIYSTMEAITIYKKRELAANPNIFGNSLERKMFFKKIFFKIPFKYQFITYYNFLLKGAFRSGSLGWKWSKIRSIVYRLREYKAIEFHNIENKHETITSEPKFR